jgi:hypothetical protein
MPGRAIKWTKKWHFQAGDDDGVDEGLALTDLLITDDEVEKQPIAEPEEEGKSESDAMAISTTDALSASVLNKSNVLSNESNKSNQIKSNVGILRFIKSNLSHRFDLKTIW